MTSHKPYLTLALGLTLMGSLALLGRPGALQASDHDDGETGIKSRNTNLTDLYVFREVDEIDQVAGNPAGTTVFGGATDPHSNMVFIMNTNPRSLPRQQYFFNQNARYEFWVKRVDTSTLAANSFANRSDGYPDLCLRFTFGAPASNQQAITLTRLFCSQGTADESSATAVSAGSSTVAPPGLGNPNPTAVVNSVALSTAGVTDNLSVFAGLREDPFFFDVTQFFRVRAGVAGAGPAVGFRAANKAIDFTRDYNVNSIALRVPLAFLQRKSDGTLSTSTAFDVWETISVPQ
jgi:Domain of unknown function (DUF4331)